HRQRAFHLDAAISPALRAGFRDDIAPPAAAGARLLDAEKALPLKHGAPAAAAAADRRLRAPPGAAAAAVRARLLARHADGLLHAAEGLDEIDLQGHLQVAAAARAAPSPAAEHAAEDFAEEIHHRVGAAEVRHRHALEALVAVAVVQTPLLRVAQ